MNSYLIIGGNLEERLKKAGQIIKGSGLKIKSSDSHPDLLKVIADLSIGINQVRQIQKFLSLRPYQASIKVVIIPEAEKMTVPAQNSFLKTLEEPPENSLIILSSQNKDQLLATIISRCQLIKLTSKTEFKLSEKEIKEKYSFFKNLLKAGPGKRLQLIEPYTKNREEAVKFCQEMILVLRKKGLAEHKEKILFFQKTLTLLKANVNVKLSLENLVLKLF